MIFLLQLSLAVPKEANIETPIKTKVQTEFSGVKTIPFHTCQIDRAASLPSLPLS
jgi:hypothetical protein